MSTDKSDNPWSSGGGDGGPSSGSSFREAFNTVLEEVEAHRGMSPSYFQWDSGSIVLSGNKLFFFFF